MMTSTDEMNGRAANVRTLVLAATLAVAALPAAVRCESPEEARATAHLSFEGIGARLPNQSRSEVSLPLKEKVIAASEAEAGNRPEDPGIRFSEQTRYENPCRPTKFQDAHTHVWDGSKGVEEGWRQLGGDLRAEIKDYERIETRVLEPERRRRARANTANIRQVLSGVWAGPYDNSFGVQTYPACASLSERYRCSRFSWLGGNDGVGLCYGLECGLRY